jgi:hypothetical protein
MRTCVHHCLLIGFNKKSIFLASYNSDGTNFNMSGVPLKFFSRIPTWYFVRNLNLNGFLCIREQPIFVIFYAVWVSLPSLIRYRLKAGFKTIWLLGIMISLATGRDFWVSVLLFLLVKTRWELSLSRQISAVKWSCVISGSQAVGFTLITWRLRNQAPSLLALPLQSLLLPVRGSFDF